MSDANTAARPAALDQPNRLTRLRMSSLGLVSMLIIQFILGMIYNLYGTGPTASKPVGMFSSPVLALHVILFFLLVIAAVAQLIRAVGTRHPLTLWMSALGLLAILAAGFAGIGFTGNGDAGASLGMSLAFAVALAAYVVLIFALAPSARSSARRGSAPARSRDPPAPHRGSSSSTPARTPRSCRAGARRASYP